MRRNYLHLWLLLAVAFAAVAALSAFGPVNIGGWELRDSGMAEAFRTSAAAGTADSAAFVLPTPAEAAAEESAFAPAPLDTASKRILFIGDSMLDGLYPRLAAYSEHNDHELYTVIWYSSTSEVWGSSGKLKGYIDRLQPDYIFICLGANELFVKDIAAKRDRHVKKLIGEIGDIPYLWIGPPNWKPDTGINALIAANTGPGQFFLSDGMTFVRGKDGAHPTHASAAEWMDSIVRWMPANCAHPIRLDPPPKATGRARRVFVHRPDEK